MILAKAYLTMAASADNYNASTSANGLKPYNDAFSGKINEYYQNCKDLCEEVIDGPYELLTNWMKMWGKGEDFDNRYNNEFIWASQSAPGLYGTAIGNQYTPNQSEYCPAGNGQYMGVAYEYVRSFDRNDVRYTDGMMWEWRDTKTTNKVEIERYRLNVDDPDYPAATANVKIYETADTLIWESEYWTMCLMKYFDKTYTVSGVGAAINVPYYRMAEAYLMYAEAENGLNGCTQDAVDKVNAIRSRVNLPTYTANQFSKEEFKERILDEYLWEFGLEAKDWYDLVRFGKLEERCYGVDTDIQGFDTKENPRPRDADDYWLPYPDKERGLNSFLKDVERMNYN